MTQYRPSTLWKVLRDSGLGVLPASAPPGPKTTTPSAELLLHCRSQFGSHSSVCGIAPAAAVPHSPARDSHGAAAAPWRQFILTLPWMRLGGEELECCYICSVFYAETHVSAFSSRFPAAGAFVFQPREKS